MIILAVISSCGSNSGENSVNENQTQKDSTKMEENEEEKNEKDLYIKENGIVQLQYNDKNFNFSCRGIFTTERSREPYPVDSSMTVKSLHFIFSGLSDQFYEGDLVVDKTLTVIAEWQDIKNLLEVGTYKCYVDFANTLSEGNVYVNNPNYYSKLNNSNGILRISKVTKVHDKFDTVNDYVWVEGEIESTELHLIIAEESKPANQTNITSKLKLQINNRCIIHNIK